MLSVLLIKGKHARHQEKVLGSELRGEEHELITETSWDEGLKIAKGEYVCLVEPEARVSDNFFHDLLDVFLEQPSFRKLAFVAPSISKPEWFDTKRIYGYKINEIGITPSYIKSSISPYSIQIGYLPGAIIRKSILGNLADVERDSVMGSVRISLRFWSEGLRCLIDPRAIYVTGAPHVEIPLLIEDSLPKDMTKLVRMFRREIIG